MVDPKTMREGHRTTLQAKATGHLANLADAHYPYVRAEGSVAWPAALQEEAEVLQK